MLQCGICAGPIWPACQKQPSLAHNDLPCRWYFLTQREGRGLQARVKSRMPVATRACKPRPSLENHKESSSYGASLSSIINGPFCRTAYPTRDDGARELALAPTAATLSHHEPGYDRHRFPGLPGAISDASGLHNRITHTSQHGAPPTPDHHLSGTGLVAIFSACDGANSGRT